MRSLTSTLCWIAAVVLAVVAVPATWVARNVTDGEGFVKLSSTLASDPDVRQEVADVVGTRLGGSSNSLPTRAVSAVTVQLLNRADASDEFQKAWNETILRTHDRLLNGQEDGAGVMVDVAPLASLAAKQIGSSTGLKLTVPSTLWVQAGQTRPDAGAISTLRRMPRLALGSWILSAAAALGIVLLARRRGRALMAVGVALAAVAGLWWVISGLTPTRLIARYASDDTEQMAHALVNRAVHGFQSGLVLPAALGGLLVVVGLVMGVVTGRRDDVS